MALKEAPLAKKKQKKKIPTPASSAKQRSNAFGDNTVAWPSHCGRQKRWQVIYFIG